jgi:hypothetical protein
MLIIEMELRAPEKAAILQCATARLRTFTEMSCIRQSTAPILLRLTVEGVTGLTSANLGTKGVANV